jgi:nucleotidyltransferase substrate binding protein (TIGR01987 family)
MKKVIKAKQSLDNLNLALTRLQEALNESPANTLIIDGTIQRFEFTIELFWKTLKRLLALEGIESSTPKDTIKKAYSAKWISNETAWLQMLHDRNETSHVYDENKAREIYDHIKQNFAELQYAYKLLSQQIKHV